MAHLLIIGGGDHARVVMDAVRSAGVHTLAGIVDAALAIGETVDGVPVVGADADLPRLRAEGPDACVIAIGSVGDPGPRVRAAAIAREAGLRLVAVVHPSATVSEGASIGAGAYVGAGAIVGTGATIGDCAIVNTGAVVDHDCAVGAFAHIAPGAVLSGRVRVGDRSHVGTGAAVMQGVSVGSDTIVGAGSAVVRDVPDGVVAYGNPCAVARDAGRVGP
jgi:sugar O-acyltransferase (sialic acid O-acetyltransferase NeuD family)